LAFFKMDSRKTIAIVFGGASLEHRESIRAARILLPYLGKLKHKYRFKFFYLTTANRWATRQASLQMVKKELPATPRFTRNFKEWDDERILELRQVDAVYNTMMGTSGENGNIMGLADLYGKPMMGCGTLASALCLDKVIAKRLATTGTPADLA